MAGYFASKSHDSYLSSLAVSVSVSLSCGLLCVVDRLSLENLCHARIESLALEWLSVPRGVGFAFRGRFYTKRCLPAQAAKTALPELKSGLSPRVECAWNVRKVITKRFIITGSQTFQNALMLRCMLKRTVTITATELIWCQTVREIWTKLCCMYHDRPFKRSFLVGSFLTRDVGPMGALKICFKLSLWVKKKKDKI